MGKRRTNKRRLRRWLARLTLVLALAPVLLILPLRWVDPPTTAFMLRHRLGGDSVRQVKYDWVDWARISPHVALAAVAAEDQKFPQHFGFDLQSIGQALNERGARVRGASTISQQVVKNLYLWPGRSLLRKALEAYLTVYLELLWPKRRILEVYLNIAEFGPGVYGVGAAAIHYFARPAAALNPGEGALLAAVLPDPTDLSVSAPSQYVRERAAWIEAQARQLGGVAYLSGL